MNASAPSFDLERLLPDPDATRLVPRSVAARYLCAPLACDEKTLHLATADPSDLEALDYLSMLTRRRVVAHRATEDQIRELIPRLYGAGGAAGASELEATVAEVARLAKEKIDGTELPIVRLVDQILAEAVRARATDVHVQPEEEDVAVRVRVDGVLRTALRLPSEARLPVATRLKVMASLDISERRLPQDGKIDLTVGERRVDLRVSTLPTSFGEAIVLRVLDRSRLLASFEELGFPTAEIARLQGILARPNGIFLVTGPTGSGKTTTLYAALRRLDTEHASVLTLEDPIEYRMAGIRQSQVHDKAGFTFAVGLRAALRQDPDVILVGEIRDGETAEIAVRAALTGHLVLSTLHTNTAIGAVARLRDMGVADFLLASTLCGVVAQRLVRRICEGCAREAAATPAEAAFLGATDLRLRRGAGCAQCNQTGFRGRFVVHELLEFGPELVRAVASGASPSELEEIGRRSGLRTMRQQGIARVLEGWTTVDELARVVL